MEKLCFLRLLRFLHLSLHASKGLMPLRDEEPQPGIQAQKFAAPMVFFNFNPLQPADRAEGC